MAYNYLTAEQAAELINNGDVIGFSGFTPAGCPKEVPSAIAKRAEKFHAEGKEFKIGMYTGASTGDSTDGALARANAVSFRTPYQSNKDMRTSLNTDGGTEYFDMHLSQLAQELRYGFLPRPNVAIIEACDLTEDGEIVLTSGVGISPTIANLADKIIIELNSRHPKTLRGIHDIYEAQDPPVRKEIPIFTPSDRAGSPVLKVDPKKIVAVVETNRKDEVGGFTQPDEITSRIGKYVSEFLTQEIKAGRIPASFLPVQSGVGNIANAVMFELGNNPDIPAFQMYTEVIQDAVIDLMKKGRVSFASGCSLTVTDPVLQEIYDNMDFFHDKLILRPQELSNNPGLVRRMGLITINTALEADIYGNINSTHVMGTKMMNGLGGSGDFTRNAYISIFTTPSTAKGGAISAIVPMVSHIDHSEHSVKVLITEHGIADLRGTSPRQRAELIINNCVDPEYRPLLREYLAMASKGHTPTNLASCFNMHRAFMETGDMRNATF
ncbi:MAG: acetyl-CoA hydrolase/transferase family protein [Paludibacteraceae bacterium]|nr:acetyl-CoA hydrolase/transferase family protein [Paludibacteraceae bacterium]MBR6686233.1 acetyl-CoA hydrolase/transferase family protein [Paludibacteraceae bacterium]